MNYENRTIRTRDDLRVDTVYVNEETSEAFVTPDCIGLIHYDTEEEAMAEHGAIAEECYLLLVEEYEAVTNV